MNRRAVFAQATRLAAAGAGAAGLLNAAVRGAAAGEDWCDTDPLVKVITPGGSHEFVHLTFSAPSSEYRQSLIAAKNSIVWTAVRSADGAGTDVTVISTVPLDGLTAFATRARVSTQPFGEGTLYSSVLGTAGVPMVNSYRLNVL
jgi:hypothetical protein